MTPRLIGSVEYRKGDAANSQTVYSTTAILRRNFWNTDTQNPHFMWESGKEGEQTMVSEAES